MNGSASSPCSQTKDDTMKNAHIAMAALAALTLSTSLSFADNVLTPGIGQIQVPAGTQMPSGDPISGSIGQIQVPGGGGAPGDAFIPAPAGGSSSAHDTFRTERRASVGCLVAGTPVEFPNDLYLTNKGTEALKAGTKLKFAVQSTGAKGALLLNTDIAVGAQVKVADVLNGGAEAGAPCTAKIL
jgi:hypothetical protein